MGEVMNGRDIRYHGQRTRNASTHSGPSPAASHPCFCSGCCCNYWCCNPCSARRSLCKEDGVHVPVACVVYWCLPACCHLLFWSLRSTFCRLIAVAEAVVVAAVATGVWSVVCRSFGSRAVCVKRW